MALGSTSRYGGGRVRIIAEVDEGPAEAGLRSLNASLGRFQSHASRYDATSRRATTTSSRFAAATGGLGRSLSSAARAGIAAASAYVGISQARDAVVATQDLAKVTAGLHRNLGLATDEASRWGAVAKARDIDTKSLNMSFTTLSRNIVDASRGSETARENFRSLGIDQRELEATQGDFHKQLLLVAKGFGDAEGGALRQQAAQKLLGRGYQTVLPLFFEGAKSLREQQHWADEYGTTLTDKTVSAQFELIDAQRESRVAWLGLQTTFATAVTPALKEANEEFQHIAKILGSDKLTNEQKLERVGKIIGHWGDEALDAFTEILPEMAEAAANRAPRIAGALAEGVIESDVWGKLFVGGWLLAKLGGAALFYNTGEAGGRRFSRGLAAGLVIGLPLLLPEWYDFVHDRRDKILQLGSDAGEWFVNGLIDAVNLGIGGINKAMDEGNVLAFLGVDAPNIGKVGKVDFEGPIEQQEALVAETKRNADRIRKNWHRGWMALADDTDAQGKRAARDAFRNFRELNRDVTGQTRDMDRKVRGSVGSMVGGVLKGFNIMGDETNQSLSALGLKQISFGLKKGDAGKAIKGAGNLLAGTFDGRAMGGRIPGYSTFDNQMVMARGGERFLTPEVQFPIADSAMWMTYGMGLDDMLRSTGGVGYRSGGYHPHPAAAGVQRFASGGKMIHPAGTPGTAVVNAAIAKQVAAWLSRYGMTLTAGYDPGGGHVSPGHNVTGTALDTVPTAGWGASPTKRFESGLSAAIRAGKKVLYGSHGVGIAYPNHGFGNHAHTEWGMGGAVSGAVAEQVARVILTGPSGPLRSMGQASLDKVHKAANAYLSKQTVGLPVGYHGPALKGSVPRIFAQMIRRRHAGGTPGLSLFEAGIVESGLRNLPYGDADSTGSLQVRASTADGMGINPMNVAQVADAFLTRGFTGSGGAISIARRSPGMSAGMVAQSVQGSAFPGRYDAVRSQALAAMKAQGLARGGRAGGGFSVRDLIHALSEALSVRVIVHGDVHTDGRALDDAIEVRLGDRRAHDVRIKRQDGVAV